jgi:hypothetical protein
MQTTYHINESELNMSFLETVKKLFKDKSLSITIEEATDETDYLLSSPKNKKRLLESIQQVKNGETIEVKNTTNLKKKLKP